MKSRLSLMIAILMVAFAAAGCGKKADANKPMDQVKAEAQKMSASDLENSAKAYADEIMKKKEELKEVSSKLKELSPKDLLGEKAKSIKDEAAGLTSQVSELTKRYEVYAQKFRETGGDMSKIKLS